jgi:hypothetical protein
MNRCVFVYVFVVHGDIDTFKHAWQGAFTFIHIFIILHKCSPKRIRSHIYTRTHIHASIHDTYMHRCTTTFKHMAERIWWPEGSRPSDMDDEPQVSLSQHTHTHICYHPRIEYFFRSRMLVVLVCARPCGKCSFRHLHIDRAARTYTCILM